MIEPDARLHRHVELLQLVLGNYLDHLARSWLGAGPTGDSATGVAAVLAAVGRPIEVPAQKLAACGRLVSELRSIDQGPLARLVERLHLDVGDEVLIAATWWTDLDPQLGSVFGVLHDDGHRRTPSSGLLHLVCRPFGITVPVQPRRLVDLGIITTDGPRHGLALTALTREILDGIVSAAERPPEVAPVPPRLQKFIGPLAALLGSSPGPVTLRGVAGSGRRCVAEAAARKAGTRLLDPERTDTELRLLARLGYGIPIVDAVRASRLEWPSDGGPLLVVALPEDPPVANRIIDIAVPSLAERKSIWEAAVTTIDLDDPTMVERLAEQFRFTERDIAETVARARLATDISGDAPSGRGLWAAAQRQTDLDLARVATRIVPMFTFDDLVLTEEVAAKLEELVAHIRFRSVVLDRWGFRSHMPRGQGVAALFSGPPGTGKTTAAEAIANELGAELFRIDLSQVVSKYIGETEKNLAIAFSEAERSGAVLLFDEADALFGKRTDVRDAHDRYANLEVSYLLQRVESFTGLAILSTNKMGNIDQAFQRRLRFVVRFDAPSFDERTRLWKRSFPKCSAVGELDWDRLARYELTGGHIQTAALSAAFLAAADGGVVHDEHLTRAISHEYEKLNRAAPSVEVPT